VRAAWGLVCAAALGVAPLSGQRVGFVIMTGTIAGDCRTTEMLLHNPNFHEYNPLMGRRPSVPRLYATCAVGTGAAIALIHLVPPRRRWIPIAAISAIEAAVVVWNLKVGGRFW
jgi:hypothetical protein